MYIFVNSAVKRKRMSTGLVKIATDRGNILKSSVIGWSFVSSLIRGDVAMREAASIAIAIADFSGSLSSMNYTYEVQLVLIS